MYSATVHVVVLPDHSGAWTLLSILIGAVVGLLLLVLHDRRRP